MSMSTKDPTFPAWRQSVVEASVVYALNDKWSIQVGAVLDRLDGQDQQPARRGARGVAKFLSARVLAISRSFGCLHRVALHRISDVAFPPRPIDNRRGSAGKRVATLVTRQNSEATQTCDDRLELIVGRNDLTARNQTGIREMSKTGENIAWSRFAFGGKAFQSQGGPRRKRKGFNDRYIARAPDSSIESPPGARMKGVEHMDGELDEGKIVCWFGVLGQPGFAWRVKFPLAQAGMGQPVHWVFPALRTIKQNE